MEHEAPRKEPTPEELKASALYFGELEDALMHYSSCLPQGKVLTATMRTDPEGQPRPEVVSETRFPPLDDLPLHLERLKFAASKLDHISVSFWKDFYRKQLQGSRGIP